MTLQSDRAAISKRADALKEKFGITQQELSERLGYAKQMLSQWKRGDDNGISASELSHRINLLETDSSTILRPVKEFHYSTGKENGLERVFNPDLQSRLHQHMTEVETTARAISRACGFSDAVLSLYLSSRYTGDVTAIERKLEEYLQLHVERQNEPKFIGGFVLTSAAKRLTEIARTCHTLCKIGVAYGDAGVGKTQAARNYSGKHDSAILIEARLGISAKGVFTILAQRLQIAGAGQVYPLFEACVDKLKDSGRIIIIDEAEHLPYKALELVRSLNDFAGVGVLLIGMPRLMENLRGLRGQFAQLYSRVFMSARIERLSLADVRAVLTAYLPDALPLAEAFLKHSHGNFRTFANLLELSNRTAQINEMKIDNDVIEQSAKLLIV